MKRAMVRIAMPVLMELLFGRDTARQMRLDMVSVDFDRALHEGDMRYELVLQIEGPEVLEGPCTAVYREVETLGGRATVFAGFKQE